MKKANVAAERRTALGDEAFIRFVTDVGGAMRCAKEHGGTRGQWQWQLRLAQREAIGEPEPKEGPLDPHVLRTRLGNSAFIQFVERNRGAASCAELFGGYANTWVRNVIEAKKELLIGHEDKVRLLKSLQDENSDLRSQIAALEDQWLNLEEIVGRACGRFPYVKPSYPEPKRRRGGLEEVVVLDLSDTQAGAKITAEETGGAEVYNAEVFVKRLDRWLEKIYVITNDILRPTIPVNNLVLLLGGDFPEGESVYRGQAFHIDQLLLEQMVLLLNEIGRAILFLAGMFKHVWVKTVDGNHGLVWETTMNLDRFLYIMLRRELERQSNVHWAISSSHWNVFQLGPPQFARPEDHPPRTFVMIHGNEIVRHYAIPNYGCDRAYREYSACVGRLVDTLFVHHHHVATIGQNLSWIINGSFPGATDYSLRRMRGASRPQQWYLTLHQEIGFNKIMPLYLDERPSLTPELDGQMSVALPEALVDPQRALEHYNQVRKQLEVPDESAP